MSANVQRLGEQVRLRRLELGFSQEDVAALGGPSDTTLSKLENGQAATVSRVTLKRLDHALGWRTGSARSVYQEGAAPQPAIHLNGDTSESVALTLTRPDDMPTEDHRRLLHATEDFYWRQVDQWRADRRHTIADAVRRGVLGDTNGDPDPGRGPSDDSRESAS